MRLFGRSVLGGETAPGLSILILPTIAEAWRTASLGTEWPIHADGPPEGHTGGFGEPTCQDCHSENELNASGGVLGVEGVPATYQPGARYRIAVVLHSDDMGSAGFQAAFRFSDGELRGTQAGRLDPMDTRVVVRKSTPNGIEYVQHTETGSHITQGELAIWHFHWTAPGDRGSVTLHVAANAANGDNSPFGDLIYAARETTKTSTLDRTFLVGSFIPGDGRLLMSGTLLDNGRTRCTLLVRSSHPLTGMASGKPKTCEELLGLAEARGVYCKRSYRS